LCWTIWTARNDLVFRGQGSNKDNCSRVFFKELGLLKHRLKQGQENQFQAWIQNLKSLAAWSRFFSFPFFILIYSLFFSCLFCLSDFLLLINPCRGFGPPVPSKKFIFYCADDQIIMSTEHGPKMLKSRPRWGGVRTWKNVSVKHVATCRLRRLYDTNPVRVAATWRWHRTIFPLLPSFYK
jgi:hypothetical protein